MKQIMSIGGKRTWLRIVFNGELRLSLRVLPFSLFVRYLTILLCIITFVMLKAYCAESDNYSCTCFNVSISE